MLLKSGIVIALFTLLSRIFGMVRELFVAATFGSSAVADCVNVAFKLPNLFRRIFGEGALSSVFIPIFNKKLLESESLARKFSGEVFVLLLGVLVVLTILMQIFMPYLMFVIAPGFYIEAEKFELTVLLCRITMPYLILVCITALLGGMLNSIRKFAAFAFVPVLMNVGVIIFTLVLNKSYAPEYGIAIALVLAGVMQVIFMFYCIWRNNLLFPVKVAKPDKDIKKLVKNMGPATLSSGAQQLNLFISQSIASFLPGAVSILSYADRLYQFPLALVGITFGTVLLPELSKIYNQKDFIKANKLQNHATCAAMVISVPAMFGLFLLAKPIIHIIYERGEFVHNDTIATADALAAFALGLPAYVLAKILTPIFYANQDTQTPLKITIYSVAVNTLLNLVLMIPFGHVGIAVGSSISAWYNVYLLNKYAKNYGDFKITYDTILFLAKVLASSLFMGVVIFVMQVKLFDDFYKDALSIKLIILMATIISGILSFTVGAYMFNLHKILIKKYEV